MPDQLPEIELETLKILRAGPDGDDGPRSVAEGVVFEPAESARSRRSRTEIMADRVPMERRERVSHLVTEVSREVQR